MAWVKDNQKVDDNLKKNYLTLLRNKGIIHLVNADMIVYVLYNLKSHSLGSSPENEEKKHTNKL